MSCLRTFAKTRAGFTATALLLALSPSPASASAGHDPRAHASIVGGAPAPEGTFASVAEIFDFRGHVGGQCTGMVVAPTLVLTAGHCAEDMSTGVVNKASGYRVITGGVSESSQRLQVSAVTGVIVYEGFRRRVDDGDAALLVLATPTTVPAVALASAASAAGVRAGVAAQMAGWGDTHAGQRLPSRELRWADTAVQSPSWCRRNAPPFFARSELCTIDPPTFATGVCQGDSGGPLLATSIPGGQPVEIGIAVHVYGRCSTHSPSVYTRVDRIASWVRTWIAAYAPKQAVTPPPPVPTPTPVSPTSPVPPTPPVSPTPPVA